MSWLSEKSTPGGTPTLADGQEELGLQTPSSDVSTGSSSPAPRPASSSSSGNPGALTERQLWLSEHVLLPLETNYQKSFSMKDIRFWEAFFAEGKWSRGEIIQALGVLENTCQFLPTAFQWRQARPKKHEGLPEFLKETPMEMLERLSKTTDPWGKLVVETTAWGLKYKDKNGYNLMPEAYTRLIEAAPKHGRPEREIDALREARAEVVRVRRAVEQTVVKSRQAKSGKQDWVSLPSREQDLSGVSEPPAFDDEELPQGAGEPMGTGPSVYPVPEGEGPGEEWGP